MGISIGTPVREEKHVIDNMGEHYVGLRAAGWVRKIGHWSHTELGLEPGFSVEADVAKVAKELFFIPYYLRANRGGKGYMRVGLLSG